MKKRLESREREREKNVGRNLKIVKKAVCEREIEGEREKREIK